jgi:hypothetical protein
MFGVEQMSFGVGLQTQRYIYVAFAVGQKKNKPKEGECPPTNVELRLGS